MSRKERISLNCSLAPPPPTSTSSWLDGSHTPNTPDILNTIVNLTAGGPLFPDYTPPRSVPPPPQMVTAAPPPPQLVTAAPPPPQMVTAALPLPRMVAPPLNSFLSPPTTQHNPR
jgi:hypothetical protein